MFRRALAVGLVLLALMNLGTPVLAGGAGTSGFEVRILDRVTDDHGNIVKEVAVIGSAVYLYEETEDYILSIGIADSGTTEVAVRYLADESVFTSVILTDELGWARTRKGTGQMMRHLDQVKTLALSGQLALQPEDVSLYRSPEAEVMTSGHEDRIMSALYGAGWPSAYYWYLRDWMWRGDVYAELRHSVSYNLVEKLGIWGWAGAAVNTVSILVGLPASTIQAIASVIMGAQGLLEFLINVRVKEYDVFCYETKSVQISGATYYWAGRTVKWIAKVADIGATLNFIYDNFHYDFYNHSALLNTGINNYLYQ